VSPQEKFLAGALVFGLAVLFWALATSTPRQEERPYILTVVSYRPPGSEYGSVSMQEFSSRLSCRRALAYVESTATKLIAECLEK
jgi:hypothetical protein